MTQLMSALGFWNTSATRHTAIEDVQGVFSGSLVSALGLYLLASAGLLTGSTAGVAFLLHYAFGVNFGLAFFLLNVPFFYLSWKRLGLAFTVKTFIAIGLTSVIADLQSRFFTISSIHPAWAALLGGVAPRLRAACALSPSRQPRRRRHSRHLSAGEFWYPRRPGAALHRPLRACRGLLRHHPAGGLLLRAWSSRPQSLPGDQPSLGSLYRALRGCVRTHAPHHGRKEPGQG